MNIDGIGELIVENPQHNELYQISITNESTDWETGYVDDFDIEFVKLLQQVPESS